jgi:hypothetical protein
MVKLKCWEFESKEVVDEHHLQVALSRETQPAVQQAFEWR